MDYTQFEGHTPGPWRSDSRREILSEEEYPHLEWPYAIVHIGGHPGVLPIADVCHNAGNQVPANARLIAAAPDLLADNAQLRAEVERLKAALEALTEHSANVNTAFYVIGTSKAMKAAMGGQKALLDAARAALGKGAA